MDLYRAILIDVDPVARREKWMEIADIAADNLWSIGVTQPTMRLRSAEGKQPLSRLARLGVQVGCVTMH